MTLDDVVVPLKLVLVMVMVGVALWTLLTNIYKSWQWADESPVETLVWCVVHTLPAGVLNTVLAMIPMIVLGPQRASLISSQLVMFVTIGFAVMGTIYMAVAIGKKEFVRFRDELAETP